MARAFLDHLSHELDDLRAAGMFKQERIITSRQQAAITVADGGEVLNFCANNYLGLANHPDVMRAAQEGIAQRGFGMASVRFICGTQDIHKELERRIADFVGQEDAVLYNSCFDANGGLFETLLGPEDAIVSDSLNHASIIDGVRLSKARRLRYANDDMADLERKLQEAQDARFRMIATDGVFSMDGIVADLEAICDLADRYDALVMVDDSHATGFLGRRGRGSIEHRGVMDRVDIVTSTLGKALGGGTGGFTAAPREITDWLRQRSRPYLFSNSVAPAVVTASLAVLDLLRDGDEVRGRLRENGTWVRETLSDAGFTLAGADHPIIPVMIGDAALASEMADRLLAEGIYVIGFSYPVVPKGRARIRTQMSAQHTPEQLRRAADAFVRVGRDLGVIP